jgi:hypothetical protein
MKNPPLILSAIAGTILFAIFFSAAGFWVAHQKIWPYGQLGEAKVILSSLLTHGEVIATGRRHRAPAGASRDFATLHDAESSIGSGHYAVLGWDNSRAAYSVFLFDASGALDHTWEIDEMTFSDDTEGKQQPPHAMEVLTDGTVLVSSDTVGRFSRYDACGDAIWSKSGVHHHSFSPAADGGIWTWYGAESAYGQTQDILKFDPLTGEDMLRISLNDDVIMRSDESALIFSMFSNFAFTPDSKSPRDIFHPNDVEELMPDMAQSFPQFDAGDLMLSIRELDLVIVITQSGEIKWYKQGPWLKQHDPDFEQDGRISIYNNSRFRPRSSILTIDPKSGDITNAMPAFAGAFKSAYRGKHQLLPNGNRLITIPEQGQALEVAPDGSIVMEFNNIVPGKKNFNDDLVNAKWLPEGFFETEPLCTS